MVQKNLRCRAEGTAGNSSRIIKIQQPQYTLAYAKAAVFISLVILFLRFIRIFRFFKHSLYFFFIIT